MPAVQALQETGIRAQYAYGSANTSLADYWFDSKIVIPGDDVRRVRETYFSSDDGLLTMGLATRGPGFCQEQVVRAEWELARELDIPITVHVAMGRLAGRFAMVKQLSDLGLLGPDTTYVHCCHFSDEEWQLVEDSGGRISIAPQVEVQMGHGWPPVLKAIEHGLRPSLSIDVVTTVPGDMFTQMRSAFGSERGRVNADGVRAERAGAQGLPHRAQMLQAATIDGAYVAGVEDRTGSLTPGKQADIVILDAKAINMAPVIDPVAAVVLCADVSNVDTVHRRRTSSASATASCSATSTRPATCVASSTRGYLPAAVAARQSDSERMAHLVRTCRRRLTSSLPPGLGERGRRATGAGRWSGRRRRGAHRVRDLPARAGRRAAGARALVRGELLRRRGRRGARHAGGLLPVRAGRLRRDPGRHTASVAQRSVSCRCSWAEMQAPTPRSAYDDDTFLVPGPASTSRPTIDVRDPRDRELRHDHAGAHGGRPGRARSCWRSRRACAPRCWSTAGSPSS